MYHHEGVRTAVFLGVSILKSLLQFLDDEAKISR